MKLIHAALSLLALPVFQADADNTPNLCTDDIPNLTKIKPSETATHPIPDITVGGETYSGDADHFVVRPELPSKSTYKRVLVYIPGTTDRPELSSCLIKSAADTLDIPVLALSYQYLSSGDSFRNGKCALLATLDEQVECLDEQHKDAIDGGNYGATTLKPDNSPFWGEVLPENALKRRLGDLVARLHVLYPTEGWNAFYQADGMINMPVWKNMIVSGHSQGAGHAAYLSKTEQLHGAVMISGPQDECIGCPDGTTFWIDEEPQESNVDSFYTALGHGSEPLFPQMKDNWMRMKAADPSMNWDTAEPSNVGFALKTEYSDACITPLQTDVKFAATSTCGGKEHCSTAIDDTVPFLELSDGSSKYYVYEASVWPALLEGANHARPCKYEGPKGGKPKGGEKRKGSKGGKEQKIDAADTMGGDLFASTP